MPAKVAEDVESYESDDYGCDDYESKGCESSYGEDWDYGSCHKRRFRRFRKRHQQLLAAGDPALRR